jgi:hypothetical protein
MASAMTHARAGLPPVIPHSETRQPMGRRDQEDNTRLIVMFDASFPVGWSGTSRVE